MLLEESNKASCQSDETFGWRMGPVNVAYNLLVLKQISLLHIYFTADLPLIAATNTDPMESHLDKWQPVMQIKWYWFVGDPGRTPKQGEGWGPNLRIRYYIIISLTFKHSFTGWWCFITLSGYFIYCIEICRNYSLSPLFFFGQLYCWRLQQKSYKWHVDLV